MPANSPESACTNLLQSEEPQIHGDGSMTLNTINFCSLLDDNCPLPPGAYLAEHIAKALCPVRHGLATSADSARTIYNETAPPDN